MSESECESRVGSITTFFTPSCLWFIFNDEISARNNFNDQLNSPSAQYSCIKSVSVGQKVIIYYGSEWVRAEIADIKLDESKNKYICWLLDYGVFVFSTTVHKLPDELKLVPPFANKVALYGLQTMLKDYSIAFVGMHEHRETEWAPGIRRFVDNTLKDGNASQTFRKRFKFEQYLVGDICIHVPDEEPFDLGHELIKRGFAKYDENAFLASLQLVKMVEKPLSIVYAQTRFYSNIHKVELMESQQISKGRGTYRSLATYARDCKKKSVDIPSIEVAEQKESSPVQEQRASTPVQEQKASPVVQEQEKADKPAKKTEEPLPGIGRGQKFKELLASKQPGGEPISLKETSPSSFGRGFHKKLESKVVEKDEIGIKTEMANLKITAGRGFGKSTKFPEKEQKLEEDLNNFIDADLVPSEFEPKYIKGNEIQKPSNLEKAPNQNIIGISEQVKSLRGILKNKIVTKNTSEIKSTGRGFTYNTDLSSSSETENSTRQTTKGRGFRQSDSEDDVFSETSAELKSFGRGFSRTSKSPTSSCSEFDSEIGFKLKSTSSNNNQFADASETESNVTDESDHKKSSIYRKSSPVVDVLHARPAGGNLVFKTMKEAAQNQNFQITVNQKRPPIEDSTKTVIESMKQFGEVFKNDENISAVKHKPVAGLCYCMNCVEWRNNNKVFEPVVLEPRKPKEKVIIKPPLLFKTGDVEDIKFKIHTERIFEHDTDKLAAPRLLVHGFLRAEPASDLPHIPFDENVQRGLRQMNYANAYSIQTYAWPAVLRGHSVILVSVPECGKTMVYVPALLSFMFNLNPFLPEENGPVSIILCPRVEVVETVYRLFATLLSKMKNEIRVQPVVQLCESYIVTRLKRGTDIIITTPRLLIKIVKEEYISLNRLNHLVLDEAHELLSLYAPEMEYIFKKTKKVLERRTVYVPVQMIVVSQEWTVPIEQLARKLRIPPLICIGAHLESALYGKANIKIQVSDSREKTAKIIQIIKNNYKKRKTVIICADTDDGKDLLQHLETHGILFESLLIESAIEDINAIKQRWYNSVADHYFVLVCSDNIFNTGLAITDAEVIVQYSLPENWSQFTFRFSGFLDLYSSPLAVKLEEMNQCLMHIIVDETNMKEFPKIVQFLQRMGVKLTQGIMDYYYKLTVQMEMERLQNKVKLCDAFLCFGECRNTLSCKYRHILCRKEDVRMHLPQSGIIKFKILHVLNPVQYFIRLIEHTDSENVVHKIVDYYGIIATQLLVLQEKDAIKIPSSKLKIGDRVAVEEKFGPTRGTLQRCQILDFVRQGKHFKKVLVWYIDIGVERYECSSKFYYLPEFLKKIPPQAIPINIANISPPDNDSSWPLRITCLLTREFKKAGFSQTNCYFISRIKLQLGNGLFVDDLKLKENINDEFVVNKLSVIDSLTTINHLSHNPKHLEKLYKECENYKIPLQDYSLPVIKVVKEIKRQISPVWAHLENLTEYNMVYFCLAQSPSSFFVKLCKNTSCLEQLNKDIQLAIKKPFYPNVVTIVEGHCYLVEDPLEQIYARALVTKLHITTAECFFVDYGDTIEVECNKLKFLPEHLITQLPFQVIECELYGIKPASDDQKWLSEATDIFYDIANEPGTDLLRYLHVKVMGDSEALFTGYKKYSVILLDTFENDIVVNNLIVDMGYATQTTDERIEVDFDNINLAHFNTESSEECDETSQYNWEVEPIPENEPVQEINLSDNEDDELDIQIYDPELCIREFLGKQDHVSTRNVPAIQSAEELVSQELGTNIKPVTIPTPQGYSIPNIVWQQTKTHVSLNIQIPSVTEYTIKVIRGRMLAFKTTCRDTDYRVDLNLYNKVDSKIEHNKWGLYVSVKMTKIVEDEWPRLVTSKEKQRNITYNAACIPVDDDSDDDKPLPKEKILSSKKLGEEFSKENENDPFVYEYGSDIDWENSDIDSEDYSDAS